MTEGPGDLEHAKSKPRRWRWALPVGAAVVVIGVVVGVVLVVSGDDDAPAAGGDEKARQEPTPPRFAVTAGGWGEMSRSDAWFQIYDIAGGDEQRSVDAVAPPSASAGEVTSIVAGPDNAFIVTAWRLESCETSFYRFVLTDDGHAKDLSPVTRVPDLAGGLAISQDGRRIAYATGGCGNDGDSSPPVTAPIALTVLDIATGQHRTWTSSRPAVVGEIVWAADNRTVGYTTAAIVPGSATVGTIEVHAMDTEDADTDLLSGRILFSQADKTDKVTTAVMNLDGRTGLGVLRREQPRSTVVFTFREGQPMHVTDTIPEDPNNATLLSFSDGSGPRYACMGGIDAFGRVYEQVLSDNSPGAQLCAIAYSPPN